ncbi:hypothetical protein BD324DRAFT_633983 [Kockovaella imperatae]|uniref:Sister chromatid cohesion protein n=1 Tax=Kockovaella imperatae TaxID=4999 RepID=A0A1Y1UAR6_9TREE|nr:hypothetical protein BD324DRAFT_633983 [Kockovaella imperatae]ORX35130.1 hypothetical protein BD324DRAFT_633983 [Kockovaella imperatae]
MSGHPDSQAHPSSSYGPGSSSTRELPESSSDTGRDDEGSPYDNPINLLSVYPFATYQPIARTAEHISPHTVLYQPQSTSSDLYPHHADYFHRIDHPSTPEDRALRKATEDRVREMMDSQSSYTSSYLPTPSPTLEPSSYLPYPTTAPPHPMPYSFIGSYLPSPASTVLQSPTPERPTTPPVEFLDNFIKNTLIQADEREAKAETARLEAQAVKEAKELAARMKRNSSSASASSTNLANGVTAKALTRDTEPSGSNSKQPMTPSHRHRESSITSHTSTPHLSRAMSRADLAQESPDPLSMHEPSPPKRMRSYSREESPTMRHSQPFSGNGHGSQSRFEVVLSTRRPVSDSSVLAKDEDDDSGSELDWGEDPRRDADGDWAMGNEGRSRASSSHALETYGGVPPGSAKTGERDKRNHHERLQNLLDDILNESDGFPADPTREDLASARFFTRLGRDGCGPLLSDSSVQQLSRYVVRVQSTKKNTQGTALKSELDVESIGRILRLLDRSMRAGQGLVTFPSDTKVNIARVKPVKSSRKKKSGSNSRSPEADVDMPVESVEEMTDKEMQDADAKLLTVQSAGIAAACCVTVLDTDGLPKHLLSEEVLSVSVGIIRQLLDTVLIPAVEALAGERISSRFLTRVISNECVSRTKKGAGGMFVHPHLSSIAQSCCIAIPRLTSLVSRTDISFDEQLVIGSVYLSTAALFAPDQLPKKGKSKDGDSGRMAIFRTLVTESLSCLRATFARYEAHRQWILEEILTNMVKNGGGNASQARFRLADGGSISTISALLLQLVQASAFGAGIRVSKLRSKGQSLESLSQSVPMVREDTSDEEQQICTGEIESAMKSSHTVLTYLVQRAAKASKGNHDTDYKAILDVFVADLLSVLYRPEWPAAALFLIVVSKTMVTPLHNSQTGNEPTHAKMVALDYLGDIAAKLKGFQMQMEKHAVKSFDEIISTSNIEEAERLTEAHANVLAFLSGSAKEDSMYQSSLDLESIVAAQEHYLAIVKIRSIVEKLDTEKSDEAAEEKARLESIAETFAASLDRIWSGEDNVFASNTSVSLESARSAVIGLAKGRALQGAFDRILDALVLSMGSTVIGVRGKALRGLSGIVGIDPTLLSHSTVRRAIESRLEDPASSVRDAAVELIGKYVVRNPSVAAQYYPPLVGRVYDTGLGVRKRVIKLLKDMFANRDRGMQVDICTKMIGLVEDMDESVKDLTVKTLSELLYPEGISNYREPATLLVEICDVYNGAWETIEKAIREISKSAKTEKPSRYDQTVKALIDDLIDNTEETEFDPLNHIRAIYLLCTAEHDLVDPNRAEKLLSYIRFPPGSDEQLTNGLILRIFTKCIPRMPKAASTFAADLNRALLPMINRPGKYDHLRETMECFCSVVNHLTLDYTNAIKILRQCEGKLRAARNSYHNGGNADWLSSDAAAVCMFICSLITEFCDLDEVAKSQSTIQSGLATITDMPIREYFFDAFLEYSKMPIAQKAPPICLGNIFKASPLLILRPESSDWMQKVFASSDYELHCRLLTNIKEFLVSESERKATGKRETDLTALIGHAESSDSGLSTAVVQRNIESILRGARSQHAATQNAAMDILAFTVHQGLYHPLQCMPILISLETSDNELVADRALQLHQHLHTKHPTLVNVRFLECARASFDYQRGLTAEVSGQRNGAALLASWYSLLGEKRTWKTDFLRQICRAFDYDVSAKGKDKIDDGFALYIAENLAAFEYKLQEEVMTTVHLLSAVISASPHLVGVLESATLDDDSGETLDDKVLSSREGEDSESFSAAAVIQASIIVGLAVITKNHLLNLYGIPEDKCVKYQLGKKSAIGDKPALPRKDDRVGMNFDRMPLVRGVHTITEFHEQRNAFLQLLLEDGTLDEMDRESA